MQKNQPQKAAGPDHSLSRRRFTQICAVSMVASIALPPAISRAASDLSELKFKPINLPDTPLVFSNSQGQEIQLSDLRGRPLLVNFWASWCAPCVHELPALERAAQSWTDIDVVLVSLDAAGPKKAATFLSDRQIETPLDLYDPKSKSARALKLAGLPATLLVPAAQTHGALHLGPAAWDEAHIKGQLAHQLAQMIAS